MSSIFKAAGDVVDDTIDVVTDNKEIIAAIALAYATGGTSIPATAEATAAVTAAELTAAEIAAAEAARIAAIETSKQAALAETIAAGKTSGEVALAGSPGFLPNTMAASQAYPALTDQVARNSAVFNPPTTAAGTYSSLEGLVAPTSPVVNVGAKDPNIFERGLTGLKDAGTAFVNDPVGSASRAFEEYRPKTPGEYFTTALSLSAGGNLISAAQQPKQTIAPRSTTNTYSGPQAPRTYVTQPASQSLETRYDTAKQQVSRTVGTPSNVGLLAVNNSPFYDFLRTNNLNKGIL